MVKSSPCNAVWPLGVSEHRLLEDDVSRIAALVMAALVAGCTWGQPDVSATANSPLPTIARSTPPPSELPSPTGVIPVASTGWTGPLSVDRLPSAGAIVFSTEVGGVSMVVRVTPNGLDVTELVPGSHPEWSPDGQLLAFSCETVPNAEFLGTCTSRADGSGRTTLIQDGYGARFSPDGARIAFFRGRIDVHDVFVTDVRAPAHGQLVGHSNKVHWSADSERLLLQGEPGRLTIVSRNGDVLQTIDGYEGAWSPDGGRIALLRIVGTTASLLLVDVTNGSVTSTGFETESPPEGIVWLAGDRIFFLMDGDIWRLDLAAPTQPVRLTMDLGADWPTLSPSPDLRWVAFTKTEGQGAGLYVASVNGGWSLIVERSQLRYPDWQPAP